MCWWPLPEGFCCFPSAPNVSISGLPIGISIVVPFLNMTKQFAGNINQVSHQINAVIMGLAGTQRIFSLMDEKPETDDGYVTLVNAREGKNGSCIECERTHGNSGRGSIPIRQTGLLTYTKLTGRRAAV